MNDETLDPPELDQLLDRATARPFGDQGADVVWATHDGERVVVKAATGRGRAALRREAAALGRIEVVGLVELCHLHDDEDMTALVTADAGHRTFDDVGEVSAEELLRALQRAAEVVDELHRAGWCHGNLSADHVVIGPRGRVRLCSLAHARPTTAGGVDRAGDVDQLLSIAEGVAANLLRRGSSVAPERRIGRRLQRLIDDVRTGHPRDPAALAAAIAEVRRATRSGRPALPRPRRGGWSPARRARATPRQLRDRRVSPDRLRAARPIALVLTAAAIVAIPVSTVFGTTDEPSPGGVLALELAGAEDPHGPAADPGAPIGPGHPASPGRPELRLGGSTYVVGLPGDVAVTGRWRCGDPTVRLLRPATGELFEFDDLATADQPSVGRVLRVIDGAVGLRAEPGPGTGPTAGGGSPACERTVVLGADGTEEELR